MQRNGLFISVIIPVYNGRKFLTRCLDAVRASSYRSFELIVVDDRSTDESADISRSKGAVVLSTDTRSGPAAARNLAAETAKGEILMFIDADVVVKPETIGRIAERFETSPEVTALFGSYDDEPAEKNFLSQYKNLQHHFVHQNSNPEASTFWSGLGAIRRDVFIANGGFDCKKFSVPSIEDIDLGFRLRRSGHRILLDADIQAKHLKKWEVWSHLRTEIFYRALPWSRLIVENAGMINDMNLKKADRLSAALVAISLFLVPLAVWRPVLVLAIAASLAAVVFLNRKILVFFARKRGVPFALMTIPWQIFYFFYSGATFAACWCWFTLFQALGLRKRAAISGTH